MASLPNIDLSYGTDMTEDYRVRRVDFGDGYAQRSQDGLNTLRQTWRLVYERVTEADAETLRLFFRGLAGTGIIEWTPFGQSTELKWTANGFSGKPSGTGIMDCTVTLVQEFDL